MMGVVKYVNDQRERLGKRIAELRVFRQYYTQKSFGKAYFNSERKTTFISQLENGKNIKFDTIIHLLVILDTTMLNLFDFNGKFPIASPTIHISESERCELELNNLANGIKKTRKRKRLVQLDVTLEGVIGDTKLSNYERAREKPESDTVAKIAYALGVEIWELFSEG